jgi:hypothetical protein
MFGRRRGPKAPPTQLQSPVDVAEQAGVPNQDRPPRGGPAWLGVGAQRSGTTWFTDLLLQHPAVTLARPGEKELHQLYRGLNEPFDEAHYLGLFEVEGLAGECTPAYLRCPWTAGTAARLVAPEVPVFALLRDPVERFASAMRLEASRGRLRSPEDVRLRGADAVWAGMYASHLDVWERALADGQLLVFQYEKVVQDPDLHVGRIWARLGLGPVTLEDVERPSRTSAAESAWDWPEGLRDALVSIYAPQVQALDRWGIDVTLWPNFS